MLRNFLICRYGVNNRAHNRPETSTRGTSRYTRDEPVHAGRTVAPLPGIRSNYAMEITDKRGLYGTFTLVSRV